MELDPSHQQLKAQLMAAFDRASRSIDSTCKKTRDISVAMTSRFKVKKVNGAANSGGEAPDTTRKEEEDESETE